MKTIRQQLTRKLILTLGLLIAAASLAVYGCARTALLAQFDAALRAKAQAITLLTEQKGGRLKLENSSEDMRGFEAGGRDYFQLWQSEAVPAEHSRSLQDAQLPLRHGARDAALVWNLTLPNGQTGRAAGLRFRPPQSPDRRSPRPPADAFLVVASECRDLNHTLLTLQLVLAGGGLLLLAATILLVPRVLRHELAPLRQLADEAARIDASSLSARFPIAGMPGELLPITARLNELLARLEDSFERERCFSSDVAHEFRTPVAELRSMAELAIKLPDARAADADHETLAIALQLESMLLNLLALARGEQGQLPVKLQPVALAPLVREVCDRFKPNAAARQLTFNCRADPAAQVDTDPGLLRSILTNLVENAVDYAPRGSVVDVDACVHDQRLSVCVANPVENLTASDLPHLFERFWRKDAARSADGHTGLGLALARVFAQSLGCQLSAHLATPTRLAVTLAPITSTPSNEPPE
ncbi:MAG: ATP-binding protein [Verrucomicrobiota bacterium]